MADTLTYDLRAGMLRGFAGGRVISVPVDPSSADVSRWDHSYEFRSGKWTVTDHAFETPRSGGKGYVLTSIQHSARVGGVRHKLVVAENAKLEVYDYPGAYAQRFDGSDPDQPIIVGSVPNPQAGRSGHSGGVNVLLADGSVRGLHFDPTFQGGIFVATAAGARAMIRPWPPIPGPGPVIVVRWGWAELVAALSQTRQVTVVVDM